MGYGYGLKQCRETLLLLSSKHEFESRIISAFSEIGVIQADDVSKAHYKEIQEWREKYLSLNELSVNATGSLEEIDKVVAISKLADELVWLCVEIIEHNARNTNKTDL